jgi:hypothetical protein
VVGYIWGKSDVPPPERIIVTQTVNVDSIEAAILETHVRKESADSVKLKLSAIIARIKAEKNGYLSNWLIALDSLSKVGHEPDAVVSNYSADSTKTVMIQMVTMYDDSIIVDTVSAKVNVHVEFWGTPIFLFHDLRIRTAPIRHQFSVIPKPNIVRDDSRGLYVGGDGGWMQGEVGFGAHIGFNNIRLGAMVVTNKGTLFQISVDK